MGRQKRRLPFWCCCKNDSTKTGSHNSFIQVSADLLFCDYFNKLGSSAKFLYILMIAAAGGQVDFTFPHRFYKGKMANDTFKKAREELKRRKFIEVVEYNKNRRIANKYRFCSEWKNSLTDDDCKRCGRCKNQP